MSKEKLNRTSIGGQALIEGVMMRGKSSVACAVRDEEKIIRVETQRLKKKRSVFTKIPFIRGAVAFGSSMYIGTKALTRSAEVFGESEPSKFEKWLAKKFNVNVFSLVITIALILAVGFSVFLFILLPIWLKELLSLIFNVKFTTLQTNLIEGGFRLLIFILYIVLVTFMKDIKRMFMYHGAEHKVINCFEHGKSMTVENARKCSKIHNRCGTTFMFFVIVVSIVFFSVLGSLVGLPENAFLRTGVKILCLPLIAGISYELLKLLALSDTVLFLPFKLPGILLQKLTTKEPDDSMIEVALVAFDRVLKLESDADYPIEAFITPQKLGVLKERIKKQFDDYNLSGDYADIDWIFCEILRVKRSELKDDLLVKPSSVKKIDSIVSQRVTGRPLWYILGYSEFHGIKLKVDERVLIPRPETELLTEEAVKLIKEGDKALDLCTGSGAIGIAIFKKTGVKVYMSDISDSALHVACENMFINECEEIKLVKSDFFNSIPKERFNVIVSNPPYIKSEDIKHLQNEVRDFEPYLALSGGMDGLNSYRKIFAKVKDFMADGGYLILECGGDQAPDIIALAKMFKNHKTVKDFNGIERILIFSDAALD